MKNFDWRIIHLAFLRECLRATQGHGYNSAPDIALVSIFIVDLSVVLSLKSQEVLVLCLEVSAHMAEVAFLLRRAPLLRVVSLCSGILYGLL